MQGVPLLHRQQRDAIIGYVYGMYNGQGTGLGEPGNVISLGSHDLLAELIARGNEDGVIWTDPEWLAAYDIAEVQVLADYRGRGIGETLVRKLCRSLPAGDRVVLTVEPWGRHARAVCSGGSQFSPLGSVTRKKQIRPAAAVASDGRRPGRGAGCGTGGRETPVQSALLVRSAVLSVQVMLSMR
jgi:GNAT superfamily N-acetyltransferase